MSSYVSRADRRHVRQRAKSVCEYCFSQEQFSPQTFECEHIVPTSAGGASSVDNLAWSCGGCNRFKSDRLDAIDLESQKTASLYNPRQDSWEEHFSWDASLTEIMGLTSIGRATISTLRLNRPGVKNLRAVLIQLGKHPPLL